MRKIILIIFIFSITPVISYAQQEFLTGFIVTNSNDTIYGEIENNKGYLSGLFCVFKNSNDTINYLKQYLPPEIKAYYLSNNRYFISKTVKIKNIERIIFAQVLIHGAVDIYKFIDNDRVLHYFIENEEMGINELYNTETIINNNGRKNLVTNRNSVGMMTLYMLDAPELKKKINGISLYRKELIDIAEEYHNIVCTDRDCKVYFYDY